MNMDAERLEYIEGLNEQEELSREDVAALIAEVRRLQDQHAIVARVWKALGITSYEQAGGKAIDELVAEAVEKAWRYDQCSK